MDNFTPVSALIGGALIGVAASMTWLLIGRIAGVSNIIGATVVSRGEHLGWRVAFLLGLFLAGLGAKLLVPGAIQFNLPGGFGQLAVAGVLVGFGTQLGNGCTSGHGVCGISRLSLRSLVATLVFMATGMIAGFVLRAGGVL